MQRYKHFHAHSNFFFVKRVINYEKMIYVNAQGI